MKHLLKYFTTFLCCFSFLSFVFIPTVFADFQISTSTSLPIATQPPLTGWGPYKGCNPDDPQKNDLICLTQKTLDMAVLIVGPLVVLMIVLSGVYYMTSMGNPTQVELAKKTLVGSIIGLIIVLTAYSMVKLLTELFK